MKFPTPLVLATALALGATTMAFAQQPAPGTEPHADGAPGAKPAPKKANKPAKHGTATPTPGTEPHADGAPGAGTAHKKSSSKPAKTSKQPEPGTEPHADGAPGAKPKQ